MVRQVLVPRGRGRKSRRIPCEEENQKLRRQGRPIDGKLLNAETIIEVQKEWLRCWGTRFPTRTRRRNLDARSQRTSQQRRQQRSLLGFARPRWLPTISTAIRFRLQRRWPRESAPHPGRTPVIFGRSPSPLSRSVLFPTRGWRGTSASKNGLSTTFPTVDDS